MRDEVRAGRRGGGGGDASGMCTGTARLRAVGARARAERTENMLFMVVTLDVSKLSAWLNAVALCGVERRACGRRDGRREGVVGGGGASGMYGEGPTQGCGRPGHARGAHVEHVVHVSDAGGIPVGDLRIEILQVIEEPAHVRDGRDVPVGDWTVRRNGGGRVGVVRIDRRL